MGLHGQDHHVLRADRLVIVESAHAGGNLLRAIGEHQLHARCANCAQIGTARDEADLLASQREPHPHVTADRSGADDGDLHSHILAA